MTSRAACYWYWKSCAPAARTLQHRHWPGAAHAFSLHVKSSGWLQIASSNSGIVTGSCTAMFFVAAVRLHWLGALRPMSKPTSSPDAIWRCCCQWHIGLGRASFLPDCECSCQPQEGTNIAEDSPVECLLTTGFCCHQGISGDLKWVPSGGPDLGVAL